MTPNPEFSQRPFAVGSLTGIRSFRVTTDGVLTGVVHQEPWASGVNEARCVDPLAKAIIAMNAAIPSFEAVSWSVHSLSCQVLGVVNLRKRPKPKPAPPSPAHDVATRECRCGFYAYYDNRHNPHHEPGNAIGIIEGFGVCSVGSRGFRASKARIRALILPGPASGSLMEADWTKVCANYPGARIFPSTEAALAEFPLTPQEVPEPYSERQEMWVTLPAGTFIVPNYMVTNLYSPRRSGKSWLADALTAANRDETAQQRALRKRRERNTGPADQRGLDGRKRRAS